MLQFLSLFRFLAFLSGITALALLIPLGLAFALGERDMIGPFAVPAVSVLCAVMPAVFFSRKAERRFSAARVLLLVCLAWVISCLMGAFPFYLSGALPRFPDAFFESVSGFTTTGATVFTDVETLPKSLLFWRVMTHWLGGMGMVVLTVALAPLLGTGAFQLFQAESPGPESTKITPRVNSTAKILWLVYVGLTALQALLLAIGGMDWFDALSHAFSTMATGGFSVRNGSIASYHSPWIEWVCILFMIIAGFNFNLIYRLLRGKGREILKNSEGRAYALIIAVCALITAFSIYPAIAENLPPGGRAGLVELSVRKALFQTVSVLTTTGFSAADLRLWPPLAQGIIFFLMCIGGCSSSTAGGFKIIRHVVLFKQCGNEARKLIYPQGVFSIQIDGKEGRKNVVYGVAGFLFLYGLLVLASVLLLCSEGMNIFPALNVSLLCLGNIGLGLFEGSMESALYGLSPHIKGALSFVMIAGRLELWTVFALFVRSCR